jgi:hypothetical protein
MTGAAEAAYDAAVAKLTLTVRDLDLDAFADGVLAHRNGEPFHKSPYDFTTLAGLSWRMGWNERALANPQSRSA